MTICHSLARRWRAGVVLALGLLGAAGCLHEASETCGDGSVCLQGQRCADAGDSRICILASCGNGVLDPGEFCDDGNNRSGDGCPADCRNPCGDGVLDPGEICDDGNNIDGDGCASDCKALDGLFQVSPPTVSFAAIEADPSPQDIEISVTLELEGDTVTAGFPPGVTQPAWLSVAVAASTTAVAKFTLHVTDPRVVGTLTTMVRFVVSHTRAAGQITFDLPVSYTVTSSDLAVAVDPGSLSFTYTAGDTSAPPQTLSVTFNGARATVLAAPSWLTVTPPADQVISPTSFTVSINDLSLPARTERVENIVFGTTNATGTLVRTATVPVAEIVLAPPGPAISAAPNQLTFAATADGVLPPPQQLSVTFNGSDPTVVSAPPWLTVSAPPSPMTSPASFAISVNSTQFAANSAFRDFVVLGTTRSGVQQTATVMVDYALAAKPDVQFVAPHLGVAGRAGTVHLRGQNFPTAAPVTVAFSDVAADPVIADSDTQLTVSYPALPAGRYAVTIPPASDATSEAELVIVEPPAFAYQAIDAPSQRVHILYDAERQMIYGINSFDQELELYAFASGAWSSLAPHVVPALEDAAMAPDGQSLIVIDDNNVYQMSLTDGLFLPVQRVGTPIDPQCGRFFDRIAAADNGQFIILTQFGCSGFTQSSLYDMRDNSLGNSFFLFRGTIGGSGDGSRIYGGSSGISPPDTMSMFDSLSSTVAGTNIDIDLSAISVSDNSSRVILENTLVYSRALSLTGNLSSTGTTLASHDSSRAFVYVEDAAGAHLDIYDLNGPLLPRALYPLVKTVMIPDRANATGSAGPMTMASSPDDSTVFISGNSKLLVVPVN